MIVGKRAGGFDGDEGWELKFQNAGDGTIRWDHETDATGRQRVEVDLPTIIDGNWHLIGGDHTDTLPGALNVWYDGAVAASRTINTPGTVDTATPLTIGAAYNTPNTNHLTGEIGPVFLFKGLLTLAEHQQMAAGFSPRFLRPLPDFLMELISRGSPEIDITGGLLGTLQNAPAVVANPRLVFPRSGEPGQDTWFEYLEATIAGQSALSATATRGRFVQASIAGQSALTADASAAVSVIATVAGQSSVTADISPEAPLKATVAAQSALTANISVDVGVATFNLKGQSGVTATLSANVPVAASITGSSAVAANVSPRVPVSAQIDGQSALTAVAKRGRTISASVGGASTLTTDTVITAGAAAQLDGQSGMSAFLSATVPLAALTGATSEIVAGASVLTPIATSIAAASNVSATLTRGRKVAATLAGQSTLVVDTRALVPVAASITGQSTLSAATVAIVRPTATIAGLSAIRARPTYPGTRKTITTGGIARWLKTVGGLIRQ
jgi:hypothetical protein